MGGVAGVGEPEVGVPGIVLGGIFGGGKGGCPGRGNGQFGGITGFGIGPPV